MSENIATVQNIYSCFGQGDIPGILSHLADNVQWEHDANDHGIPWLKPGVGVDHVASFFKELAAIDITVFDVQNIMAAGNQVASVIQLEATVKATGQSFKDIEMHLWTFDEGGRVAKYRHMTDTHGIKKALGAK